MVMKSSSAKSKALVIPAGEFKAKCLQLMDDVHTAHGDIIVTKRGVPMVRVIPFEQPKPRPFRSVLGRSKPIQVVDDLIAPLPEEDTIPIDPFLG
jgi:prevent-host-death family protein